MREIRAGSAHIAHGSCSCNCSPNQDANNVSNNARSTHEHHGGCACSCLFADDRNNAYNNSYNSNH